MRFNVLVIGEGADGRLEAFEEVYGSGRDLSGRTAQFDRRTAIGLYRLLPTADKYGVPVPEKVRAWVTEYVVRQAQASVDDAQRALNERLRVLAQARGEV